MKPLELPKRHMDKGSLHSPVRLRIVRHLKVHGACTTAQLAAALLAARLVSEDELGSKADWLQNHLAKLRIAGHIASVPNSEQLLVWRIAEETTAEDDAAGQDDEASAVYSLPAVAGPRQVDMLYGPVYRSPTMTPARRGAMDFAKAPSLVSGRRVPYWGTP